ncbi:MAG: acyl-CoA synthetase [Frankiales bacterium]|nr:acyl-CoA synthetase [Frankiales bacterium]
MPASLSDLVRSLPPEGTAYVTPTRRTTWGELDAMADAVAVSLRDLEPGERVGIRLPDDETVHAAFLGTERAGVIGVGIGARAGEAEVAHLVRRTGARRVLTSLPSGSGSPDPARALGREDLWLLNSTSGTTGMPKVVTQTMDRWIRFVGHAVDCGDLGADERLMSVIPAPFGFGLWTSHVAPIVLGAPCVVLPRFDVPTMARLIAEERVTVLCCVSTQFRMLLNHPASDEHDLSSLKVMFTGGEMIPPDRAREFEDRTGAVVLSFFGSNETGALTATRHDDPREKRLTTVGRVLPSMEVRLYDEGGAVTSGTGIPGGRGPLLCQGYWDDAAANELLYAPDGFMLMGDVVSIDEDGWMTVVGRTSDIIIRGGKNISAVTVENAVDSHPSVDAVGIVPVSDEVFGERVCAVVTLVPGTTLTLEELIAHLDGAGLGKESWPEHLLVLEELPRSSGGKLAKRSLRDLAERHFRPPHP